MVLSDEYISLLRDIVASVRDKTFSNSRESGEFTRLSAQLVWQFVRFNPTYIEHYDQTKRKSKIDSELIFQKFGISEAVNPREVRLPDGVTFRSSPSLFAKAGRLHSQKLETFLNYSYELVDFHMKNQASLPNEEGPMVAVINPLKGRKAILEEVGTMLDKFWPEASTEVVRSAKKGSLLKVGDLVARVICYVGKDLDGLNVKEIEYIRQRVFGSYSKREKPLNDNEVKKRIKTFKEISYSAPWSLFVHSTK